jgi:hypothetical protein
MADCARALWVDLSAYECLANKCAQHYVESAQIANPPHPEVAHCARTLWVDFVGCIRQVSSLQQLRQQQPVKHRRALQQNVDTWQNLSLNY